MSRRIKKEILELEGELLCVDFMQLKWAKNDEEYVEFKELCDYKIKKLEELKYNNMFELTSFYNGIILASIKRGYEKGGQLYSILPTWLVIKIRRAYNAKEIFFYSFTDKKGVPWNIMLNWIDENGDGNLEYVGLITALKEDRTLHYKMASAEKFFQSDAIEFERVS